MSKDFKNLLDGALANKVNADDDVRSKVVIRENLKELIPPLSQEELNQLETNLFSEGIREPLILWQVEDEYVIVDGHNRYSFCQKFKWKFPFKIMHFENEDEVKDWMVKNQLGRRNLSPEQQSYLRGLRYLSERTIQSDENLTGQNVPRKREDTSERLASEYNVSPKTIKRDAQFAQGVDLIGKENPELKKEILQGKSKIKKKDIESLVRKPKQTGSLESKIKMSAQEIASIAIEYAKTEKRTFDEVIQDLSLDVRNLQAIEFFVTWSKSQNKMQNQ
jgi:ParB-like chromosome segregation protein Spo0J